MWSKGPTSSTQTVVIKPLWLYGCLANYFYPISIERASLLIAAGQQQTSLCYNACKTDALRNYFVPLRDNPTNFFCFERILLSDVSSRSRKLSAEQRAHEIELWKRYVFEVADLRLTLVLLYVDFLQNCGYIDVVLAWNNIVWWKYNGICFPRSLTISVPGGGRWWWGYSPNINCIGMCGVELVHSVQQFKNSNTPRGNVFNRCLVRDMRSANWMNICLLKPFSVAALVSL